MMYVWSKDRVVQCDWIWAMRYENCFVYDPLEMRLERWGIIVKGRYMTKEIHEVPKEFRASLLLLGAL